MELRHLRHFAAIAERLSFSKAAEALHLSQPALSRQIQGLEDELGCALFERLPSEIRLTPEGEYLRDRATALLTGVDDLVQEMKSRGKTRVRRLRLAHFGTFLELFMVPFLHRLHQRHPGWQIDLLELEPAKALRSLARGEVDAASTGRPEPHLLEGLETRLLWVDSPLLVVPADHALAKRRAVRLADLRGERLLIWDETQYPGFGDAFAVACRGAGFEPEIERRVDSVAGVFTGVARESLVGYVGRLVGQLPAPGVSLVPLAEGELGLDTMLAWRRSCPGAHVLAELAGMLAASPPLTVRRPAG
jgi:DNA-binding transcriptional LysR family regulator